MRGICTRRLYTAPASSGPHWQSSSCKRNTYIVHTCMLIAPPRISTVSTISTTIISSYFFLHVSSIFIVYYGVMASTPKTRNRKEKRRKEKYQTKIRKPRLRLLPTLQKKLLRSVSQICIICTMVYHNPSLMITSIVPYVQPKLNPTPFLSRGIKTKIAKQSKNWEKSQCDRWAKVFLSQALTSGHHHALSLSPSLSLSFPSSSCSSS